MVCLIINLDLEPAVPSLPAVSLHQPHHHTCRAERCLREFQTASPRFVTKTTKGGEVFNKTRCEISPFAKFHGHIFPMQIFQIIFKCFILGGLQRNDCVLWSEGQQRTSRVKPQN